MNVGPCSRANVAPCSLGPAPRGRISRMDVMIDMISCGGYSPVFAKDFSSWTSWPGTFSLGPRGPRSQRISTFSGASWLTYRMLLGVLDPLCNGPVNALLVLGEASWPRDGAADCFNKAPSTCGAMCSSCAGTAVALDMRALRAVHGVSVCVEVGLIYPDLTRHRGRRRCRCLAARLERVLKSDLYRGALPLGPGRDLDRPELLRTPPFIDRLPLD